MAGKSVTPQTDRTRHRAAEDAKRKRTRKARGEIHAAMDVAARMKRSRRKGTSDIAANLAMLGWHQVDWSPGADVLEKFERIAA